MPRTAAPATPAATAATATAAVAVPAPDAIPAPPAGPGPAPAARHFKELVSFRLNMLASAWSRLAAESNARDFGLDPREWRILGMLGASAPMSLQGLAREINVDKSQASRAVSALAGRGLLHRGADESDGRGVQLSLTREGRALYRKVFPRAARRNEELLSVLDAQERAVLESALDRLTAHAHATLARARAQAERKAARKTAG
ncbi:MAG: MarR family transcriptional regulator [Xylophilus ampelinus]